MYRALLDQAVERLDRRTAWELAVTDGHLYLTVGGETLEGAVARYPLTPNAR